MSERAEQLIAQLADFQTRSEAKRQLVRLGSEAVEPLVTALSRTRNRSAHWSIISALEAIGDARALGPLVSLLEQGTEEESAVVQALEALTGKHCGNDAAQWRRVVGSEDAGAGASTTAEQVCIEGLVREALADTDIAIKARGERIACRVELPGDRHQEVQVLAARDPDGEPLIGFYTECGPADPARYEWALRKNVSIPFGRYAIRKSEGKSIFVMVSVLPRQHVEPMDVLKTIRTLAARGDRLEKYLREEDET